MKETSSSLSLSLSPALRTQPEEYGRIGQSHRSDSEFINFIPFSLLGPSCILEILRPSYLLFHPPLLLTAKTSFFEEEESARKRESMGVRKGEKEKMRNP